MNGEKTKVIREVNYKWDRVMKLTSAIKYGNIILEIIDGEPKRVKRPLQEFNLDISEKDFDDRLKTIGVA
jgi:hypothetical protein